MMFYSMGTDSHKRDAGYLKNKFASVDESPVFIMGCSDTLTDEEYDLINQSHIPVFGINYSGRGKDGEGWKCKPNFWTAFDSTPRFHKSIYLDPSIMKFVITNRHKDLISGTDEKLCDAPNIYFFENEHRTYDNFFNQSSQKVNHSLDSFIQALDIAFHLGFRTFYCVNTEMIVRPSQAQIDYAVSKGVQYENGQVLRTVVDREGQPQQYWSDLLFDFVRECMRNQVEPSNDLLYAKMEELDREAQYCHSEIKPFASAAKSDEHYWERVQYLRLSRKNMRLNGVNLFSCSPTSRLAHWFPVKSVYDAVEDHTIFDVRSEAIKGVYTGRELKLDHLPYHKDIKPYGASEGLQNANKQGGCKGCNKKEEIKEDKQPKGILDKIVELEINDALKIDEVK